MNGGDNQLHDFEVGLLVVSAYVIYFAFLAFAHNEVDSLAVVFHVKPVAHVAAVTVDGQTLSFKDILDNQWNQFLRKMIRTVVIRATGNRNRHFIRIMISHYEHIRTRFGSAVRAVRTKRGRFGEITFGSERAIHFVGRHLMIAHTLSPSRITLFVFTHHPCTTCTVQQVLCSEDIRNQEQLRIFDAAVHMTFGSKIHYIVKAVLSKKTVYDITVTNISLDKETAFVVNVFGNRSQVTCIRQSVQYHDFDIAVFGQDVLDVIRTDKTCGTGH